MKNLFSARMCLIAVLLLFSGCGANKVVPKDRPPIPLPTGDPVGGGQTYADMEAELDEQDPSAASATVSPSEELTPGQVHSVGPDGKTLVQPASGDGDQPSLGREE